MPRPEDRGKDRQYFDGKLDGLALRCKATGSTAWRFDFYYGGKRQPITLGPAGDTLPALDYEAAKGEYLKAALARPQIPPRSAPAGEGGAGRCPLRGDRPRGFGAVLPGQARR